MGYVDLELLPDRRLFVHWVIGKFPPAELRQACARLKTLYPHATEVVGYRRLPFLIAPFVWGARSTRERAEAE